MESTGIREGRRGKGENSKEKKEGEPGRRGSLPPRRRELPLELSSVSPCGSLSPSGGGVYISPPAGPSGLLNLQESSNPVSGQLAGQE